MQQARGRCISLGIPVIEGYRLPRKYFRMHRDGYWPPHTPGFGPDVSVRPRGWCNPDSPNFDAQTVENALAEQEEYDRAISPEAENQATEALLLRTEALLQDLRKVLVPREDD